MSEIILAGETALKCYKSLRVQEYPLTQAILRKNVKVPTVDELENIKYEWGITDKKLEILLCKPTRFDDNLSIRPRYFSSCRQGIIMKVTPDHFEYPLEDIFIVSPAFLLAQLAPRWNFINLFLLALEFAGTFSISDNTGAVLSDLEPVLTKKTLCGMVAKLKPTRWRGMGNLEKTANYLEDFSASPMESELYCKLALPTKNGGLGIKGLKLNASIKLRSAATKICGKANVRVDVLHPGSKVVIEYDSRQYHSSIDQSQYDKRRRDALQHDGYKCFSIVPQQINNCEVFNACMKPVIIAIKGRSRKPRTTFQLKQQQLFRDLDAARKLYSDNGYSWEK